MAVERRGDLIEGGELGQPLRREELEDIAQGLCDTQAH